MRTWSTVFCLILLCFKANGQLFSVKCKLPSVLAESSGIESLGTGFYLSLNDGGNAEEIYVIDSFCNMIKTIKVIGYPNNDWEDISLDEKGNLFIGDFGNNSNKRKDLSIGVVTDFVKSLPDTIYPKVINFHFENQHTFPPKSEHFEFDCEAISVYKDSIYLITKNRSDPFNGWTKLYVLPNKLGTYPAKLVDSIETGTIKEIAWITGMDIRLNELVMVGSAYVWWYEFGQYPRFETLKAKFEVFPLSQKEAIAFDGNSFVITDESYGGFGSIYRLSELDKLDVSQIKQHKFDIAWIDDSVIISSTKKMKDLFIYDLSGKVVWSKKNITTDFIHLHPDSEGIRNGMFLMKLNTSDGQYYVKKIIVK